jgi:hypothetical protein
MICPPAGGRYEIYGLPPEFALILFPICGSLELCSALLERHAAGIAVLVER